MDEATVLIGFSSGELSLVSVSPGDIGTLKHITRGEGPGLTTFAYNPQMGKVATLPVTGSAYMTPLI